jgi:DNA-binding NarL/FixJ family response regulator
MTTLRSPSVSSPTLIGREAQLALLTDLLTLACSGQSRIALIAGEAGIGKSRLVAEIKARAGLLGGQIVQGRCFEQERALPYAPLIDLLRTFCLGRSADELAHACGSTAVELTKISPDLAAALPHLRPTPTLEPAQEKRRLFQTCIQFVRQLATAEQPLLLVVEDLHWCDDTSLDWLLVFAHQLTTQPVLVLLTYRSDEIHPILNQLLAALDRLPLVSELRLPRLSRTDVQAMLHAIFQLTQPPRADFLDALYALTDGNPLFIEEVLKSLIASGDIYQEGGEWTRKPLSELNIPRTVQVAVQQRTRQLSEAAHTLLTLSAVAGQRFDFDVLQAITQQSESELLRQVKELLAAQLVVEESDETFAFRHALTRQAIYSALLARERKALHRAVAEALERCYADVLDSHAGELAYQFYEAGLWPQALTWAQRAAENATRLYAHGEALSHYTRARECAERLGQTDQVAAIDHAIGHVHRARGEFPQARETYARALHATTDPARRAVLKAELGDAYLGTADERALAYLHAALDELSPTTQTKDIARVTLWLGRYYHLRAQYTQAVTYLDRARELLEPLDDAATLRFAYQYLAAALMFSARFEQSIYWLRRLIALGEAQQSLPAVAVGYWYLSFNALCLGQWQDADEHASRGQSNVQTLTRQSGGQDAWIGIPLVYAAYYRGDLARGVRLARESGQLATELRDRRGLMYVSRMLVVLETALGAEEAAAAVGEPALRDADELMEVTIRCWSRIALADLYRQREEWDRASALYEQCADLLASTENRLVQMELGAPMAEAYCAQGRLGEAIQIIADTLALTQATGARHYEAMAWRVQGQICAAHGRTDDAAQAFDSAIALCEALGSRLELAHALYQRGTLHQTRDNIEAAHADWMRARTLCEQMGAQALLWRTHAALGQLARAQQHLIQAEHEFTAARTIVEELAAQMRDESFRESLLRRAAALIPAEPLVVSRGVTKSGFGGLTARERAVAALIAQGRSNREIAQALVVSERTVTTHVSNIFAKLGFTSRAQVATWAGEHGLATPTAE